MRTTATLYLGLLWAATACGSANKNDGKVASGGKVGGDAATAAGATTAAIRAPQVPERALRGIFALRYVRIAADGALTLGEIPQAAFKDGLLDPAKLGPGKATTRAALAADLEALTADIDTKMRLPTPPGADPADDPPPPEPPDPAGPRDPSVDLGVRMALAEGQLGEGRDAYYATGPDDVIARPLAADRDPPMSAPLIIADPERPARELLDAIRAAGSSASLAVTADGTHLRAFAARIEPGGLGLGGLGPMDAHTAVVVNGAAAQVAIDAYDGKTAKPDRFTWRGAIGDVPAALTRAGATPDLQTHHDMRLWFDGTLTAGAMIALLDAMLTAGADPVVIGDPAQIATPEMNGTIGIGRPGTLGHGAATGGGSAAPRIEPRVTLGTATTTGDGAQVQRMLTRSQVKLAYCYEKALLMDPSLHGQVALRFTVAPDGTVSDATAAGVAEEVAGCMRDVVKAIAFPRRARAAQVEVAVDTAVAGG
jgi:hypothetical protein